MVNLLPIILIVGGAILIIISIVGIIVVSRKEKPGSVFPAGGVYIHEIGQNPYGQANFPPPIANPTEPVRTPDLNRGTPMGGTAPSSAQQSAQCPNCGSAVPGNAVFCPYCGYRKA